MAYSIIYLSYDGIIDPLGQSQILPYIYGLSNEDYKFTIVSFEKRENRKKIKEQKAELDDLGISWMPLYYTKYPPVLSTIYDLIRLDRLVNKLHKKRPFDLIHCRSYLTSLIGLRFKKRYKAKFVFDMRGFWADERVEGGLWPQSNLVYKAIYKWFKKKEISFFRESDLTISLTHAGKNEILKIFPNTQIQVIPCCVDTQLFNPENLSTEAIALVKTTHGIKNERVIGYLGSLGTWYDAKKMVKIFEHYHKTQPTKFLIITKSDPGLILSYTKDDLKDDIIFTSGNREEIPLLLSMVDIGLFIYHKGFSRLACSPTKLGEMMAMNVPVIGNDIGDTKMIIEKYQAGFLSDGESHPSHELTKKGRDGALDYFSLEKGIRDYLITYEKSLKGDSSTRSKAH